jgi:hypothetical protein
MALFQPKSESKSDAMRSAGVVAVAVVVTACKLATPVCRTYLDRFGMDLASDSLFAALTDNASRSWSISMPQSPWKVSKIT